MKVYPEGNIASVDYDVKAKVLTVTFRKGGTYTYDTVPGFIYAGFLTADSPGKYFHKVVKGQYNTRKMEVKDDA